MDPAWHAHIGGQQGGPRGQAAELLVQGAGLLCIGHLTVPEFDGVHDCVFSASGCLGHAELQQTHTDTPACLQHCQTRAAATYTYGHAGLFTTDTVRHVQLQHKHIDTPACLQHTL